MVTKAVSSGSVDLLPDEILVQILSFLPTKQAACTSILSKRWRNLLHLMNLLCASLDFDESDFLHNNNNFRDFLEKTLFSCPNSLRKFSLKCQDDVHNMARTRRWITKAMKRCVSDLDLRITMPFFVSNVPNLLPDSVYFSNTLVKLTLGTERCLGNAPPLDIIELPLLKSLFLHTVWWRDFDLCDEIISGSPELEELYIDHKYLPDTREDSCGALYPPPQHIGHGNMKKLTIHFNDHIGFPRYMFLCTPNVTYLDYSDYLTCVYHLTTTSFNALVETRLNLVFCPRGRFGYEHENFSKLMKHIRNTQILYLSSYTIEVMYDCLEYWNNNGGFPLLKSLTSLHFECNNKEYWKLLTNIIEFSPKLEMLVLKGLCNISDSEVVQIGGNVVKVLEIQGFSGRLGELNQVKYLLWAMENLEEIKVNINDAIVNKLQLTNDLLALPKRSSKCNINVL